MLTPARRLALLAALALAALATAAAPASAGEYSVSVCRHADGSIAPTEGWQLAIADDFSANDTASNTCSFGGQIDLELRSGTNHGRFQGITYTSAVVSFSTSPPSGTSWRQADVWWAYQANPAGAGGGAEHVTGSIAGTTQATCAWGSDSASPCSGRGSLAGPPLNPANQSTVALEGAQSTAPLAVSISCSYAPLACPSVSGNDYAQLRAWRLLVRLADPSAPAFSSQPALPDHAVGSVAVSISATDSGSGLRTAQLVVDGHTTGAPKIIDTADGHCDQQADGSYGYLVPCRPSVSAKALALDAGDITNGTHAVAVRIADAAGNTVDSKPHEMVLEKAVPLASIPIDNPLRGQGHVHNGSGSAVAGKLTGGLRHGSKGKLSTSMRVRRGGRVRLAGRLLDAGGKPIAGALLSVTTSPKGAKAKRFRVRTRQNGTYARTLHWGRSSRIVVRWYPWADSTTAVHSRTLRLLGIARVSLAVGPKRPRNGAALHFTGKVGGAKAGVRVTLQVRVGGVWRTFLTPAVNKKGRFNARRTLSQSAGVSYCLRARVLSQPGFGYAAGSSRSVCRRVL